MSRALLKLRMGNMTSSLCEDALQTHRKTEKERKERQEKERKERIREERERDLEARKMAETVPGMTEQFTGERKRAEMYLRTVTGAIKDSEKMSRLARMLRAETCQRLLFIFQQHAGWVSVNAQQGGCGEGQEEGRGRPGREAKSKGEVECQVGGGGGGGGGGGAAAAEGGGGGGGERGGGGGERGGGGGGDDIVMILCTHTHTHQHTRTYTHTHTHTHTHTICIYVSLRGGPLRL